MADFVRFRTEYGEELVNVDQVTCVKKYHEYDWAGNITFSEDKTEIYLNGDASVLTIEPFEDVAAKLNRLF